MEAKVHLSSAGKRLRSLLGSLFSVASKAKGLWNHWLPALGPLVGASFSMETRAQTRRAGARASRPPRRTIRPSSGIVPTR